MTRRARSLQHFVTRRDVPVSGHPQSLFDLVHKNFMIRSQENEVKPGDS